MKDSVISQRVQDEFVFLCITDSEFLKICRNSVPTKYFSSQVTEDFIRICYSYYDQFGEAPKDHFHDELARFLNDASEDKKYLYSTYAGKISGMECPNKKYVLSRINKFIRAQEWSAAAIRFSEMVARGEFEKSREFIQRALRVGIESEELGINYLSNFPPSYYSESGGPKEVVIPSGFPIIDEQIKGFYRGQFITVFAGYKVGKTWAGVHFGKEGLIHGRKVLHITHEISAEELEMRYDMALGALTSKDGVTTLELEEVDEEGGIIGTFEREFDTVYNLQKVKSIRKKVAVFGGQLIIRKYPMGSKKVSYGKLHNGRD